MDPHAVRSETDRTLATQLLADARVRQMRDALARAGKTGTRRNLLARALRLTPQVAPEVHEVLDHCITALGVTTEVETYVYPAAAYNAGCTPVEDGRVFVLFSSALLEAFSTDELAYVAGHELGHHVYGHLDVPLAMILQNKQHLPAPFVLKAHTWQRHAEISADRAGMICSGGLQPTVRSLFKLSSGLHDAPGPVEIAAFLEQAHELYEEASSGDNTDRVLHADHYASHPFSPIRLRAAKAFSEVMSGSRDLGAVEGDVVDLMGLMEPSYLDEDTSAAEAMRRLLFAAGAVVANAYNGIVAAELEALSALLGPSRVPRKLNAELLAQHLPGRVARVKELVPRSRRGQLIRDLAVIARADGHVQDEEVAVMRQLARDLQVDCEIVRVVLGEPREVD